MTDDAMETGPLGKERRTHLDRRKSGRLCPLALDQCPGVKPKEAEPRFTKFLWMVITALCAVVSLLLANWGWSVQNDLGNLKAHDIISTKEFSEFKTEMAKHVSSIDSSLSDMKTKLDNVTTVIVKK